MKQPSALSGLAAALVAGTLAVSAGTAQGQTDPPPAAYGIGEVDVNDPRILDLSGDYTISGTTVSVSFHMVQDGRGRLAGNYTLTLDGNTTGPFPAFGSLMTGPRQPVRFEFGRRPRPQSVQHHRNIGPGPGPGSPPPGPSVHIRGVQHEGGFRTTAVVNTRRGPMALRGPLVPDNPARGATVGDAQAVRVSPSTLLSTRTLTLPWGTRLARAVERTDLAGSHFGVNQRTLQPTTHLAPPPPFALRLDGSATSGDDFNVHLSHIRLGYGALDSTTATAVTKTAFPPATP